MSVIDQSVRLGELLANLTDQPYPEGTLVKGLTLDSREAVPGDLFVALNGGKQHGLLHAQQAIDRGVIGILFDPAGNGHQLARTLSVVNETKLLLIPLDNLGWKLGKLAARFFGWPSQQMDVIGITGTNGKTSCSQFLGQLLDRCGIIGTLGWGNWGELTATLNTTPDALAVHKMLRELYRRGNKRVAMEVSSHGLDLGRVNGVQFKGAVFTNISRDHLDYHGTMEAYLQAKLTLLASPGLSFAVVNRDSDYSDRIMAAIPESVSVWSVSAKGKPIDNSEWVWADSIIHDVDGIRFTVHWCDQARSLVVPLYGDFNIENILLVLAVMLAISMPFDQAINRLSTVRPVNGRMERFAVRGAPLVFVDYAHTPDALENVLSSLRKHCRQSLWVVFGCGGNRDKGKRPQMGKVAGQWADYVIVTDDNPRDEDGMEIIQDILSGCTDSTSRVEVIQDRKKAIQDAILNATEDDCIVIAGKGHEQYQEYKGVRLPFSDSGMVLDALNQRNERDKPCL